MTVEELTEGILRGDKKAIARSITLLDDIDEAKKILKAVNDKTGNAYLIGITGAAGTGKSTLISAVTKDYRNKGFKVGILAIDPTSPYTGGALLGDRIRMQEHFTDNGVFIRSMATRGQLGGLAKEVYNAAKILDAAGFERIIIETVGVGQDEVDIVKIADSTLLVMVPGYGDEVQVLKAGIMEIADIFVINKADKDGADKIRMMIEAELNSHECEKKPQVYSTVAVEDKGITELVNGIEQHLEQLKQQNLLEAKRKERLKNEIYNLMSNEIKKLIEEKIDIKKEVEEALGKKIDPYSVVEKVIKAIRE